MKEISTWAVILVMSVFSSRYAYQIWKKEINPTLSTWIIFLLGTGLSLVTYAIAERHDFRSGILNTMDVVAVMVVLVATIVWGNRGLKMRFRPFEKWYLAGIGIIVLYGFVSGNAFQSNILTQILISIGYFPTIQNLLIQKQNTESFTGWSCIVFAAMIALYPAIMDGNALAIIYAVRTIVLATVIMSIMIYYEFNS